MPRTATATVHHLVDKRFVGITPDGMRVMIDGEQTAQTGMRPMQLLLNAVGACAAYDVVEMLRKRRLDIRDYRVELEGTRPDETPSPYRAVVARHVFDVPGLDEATARRFAELATSKYCSVAASLTADVRVEVALEHDEVEMA